jgi:sulfate adenylyltransferase subunit 2
MRVFPISNWTELDVWNYIRDAGIEVPHVYMAHEREVFMRDGMWLALTDFLRPAATETVERRTVRFRTIGDATCTGAVESAADSLDKVIDEVAATRVTERGATRADDRTSEAAMEDRKKEGYF